MQEGRRRTSAELADEARRLHSAARERRAGARASRPGKLILRAQTLRCSPLLLPGSAREAPAA